MDESKLVRGRNGMVDMETSRLILLAIFPNWPSLHPTNPLPEWAKEKC